MQQLKKKLSKSFDAADYMAQVKAETHQRANGKTVATPFREDSLLNPPVPRSSAWVQ